MPPWHSRRWPRMFRCRTIDSTVSNGCDCNKSMCLSPTIAFMNTSGDGVCAERSNHERYLLCEWDDISFEDRWNPIYMTFRAYHISCCILSSLRTRKQANYSKHPVSFDLAIVHILLREVDRFPVNQSEMHVALSRQKKSLLSTKFEYNVRELA